MTKKYDFFLVKSHKEAKLVLQSNQVYAFFPHGAEYPSHMT